MSIKPVDLNHTIMIVAREMMLFCLCPDCTNEVNWAHTDATHQLTAQCCWYTYRAAPLDAKIGYYRIEKKKADSTNVVKWVKRIRS